jgi:hypothetical protein
MQNQSLLRQFDMSTFHYVAPPEDLFTQKELCIIHTFIEVLCDMGYSLTLDDFILRYKYHLCGRITQKE